MKKSGLSQDCDHCGKPFYVPQWRARRGTPVRFCSMACLYAGRSKPESHLVDSTCEGCGKTYRVAPYRSAITKFCSKACHGAKWFVAAAEARRAGNKSRPKMSPEELKAAKKRWDQEDYQRHKSERNKKSLEKYYSNHEERKAKNRARAKSDPKKTERNRLKRERYGERLRANRRQHYQDNKSRYIANARSRENHIKQATPSWADMEAIAAFYAEAERLTLETGIKHHVDHKYPLRSRIMCGLHVETNLQVIQAAVNLRKSNKILEDA